MADAHDTRPINQEGRQAPMLIKKKNTHKLHRDYNNIPNDLGTAVNIQVRWWA